MVSRLVLLVVITVIAGCEADVAPSAVSDRDATTDLMVEQDGGVRRTPELVDAADGVEFRARWCQNEGRDPGDRTAALARVARDYEAARTSDCRTRGMLPELEAAQTMRWLDYLIGYSTVMLGCPPRSTPVPGGILAFGPANTTAIGVSRPALGRDDAELLIRYYLTSLSASVPLSEAESAHVEAQLRETAEAVVNVALTAGLSTCSGDGGA